MPKSRIWLTARIAVYIVAAAALFWARQSVDWRRMKPGRSSPGSAAAELTLAGNDLAPRLLETVVAFYRRDYPDLKIRLEGGGTNQALEALGNRRADVAFLSRPVTREEQTLFHSSIGDTVLCFPVALGGLVFLTGHASRVASLSESELIDFLEGRPAGFGKMYVPDPNLGLWPALLARLHMPGNLDSARVVFLESGDAVRDAVRADPDAVGLVSSLASPEEVPEGVRRLPFRTGAEGDSLVNPAFEDVATGAYPLDHWLYVGCLSRGDIEGTKFVTHITSDRGQRQIERAAFIPARRALRRVELTRGPMGVSG